MNYILEIDLTTFQRLGEHIGIRIQYLQITSSRPGSPLISFRVHVNIMGIIHVGNHPRSPNCSMTVGYRENIMLYTICRRIRNNSIIYQNTHVRRIRITMHNHQSHRGKRFHIKFTGHHLGNAILFIRYRKTKRIFSRWGCHLVIQFSFLPNHIIYNLSRFRVRHIRLLKNLPFVR